ncbi:helix-turn-helix transcriptional regulator [Pelosinus propionicus]|uniref:Predicted DNA-binding transcriptional regulator YafY, contains an HTH and WYL domains n=1 Tax=Pelosinus propionicus DSM 13327 TaxID=1123291 RepID=A0A1I4K9X0_9FIRM|nr:WYL domain-containing protein [Pelosinus propionicus]SFL75306.1 Predicted DNA-binding transcriptional regulator YafY, contains an HTH and WYL domains [Pelosinus propionicus DSM 13327]
MKKSERINDMMIYLNDKKSFNLKNIMERYSISKSTALRDIQSLEEIGMPIYSNSGRNGCYGILPNRLLSPIVFTIDEVHALYFSMQTLNAYQSTPFHLSVEKLKQKFESCISEERIKRLRKMDLIFSLGSYQNKNECGCLEHILNMAIEENVCEVRYTKGEVEKQFYVQFFDITSAYGQWYASAYNFQTKKPQVFRCDKIHSVQRSDKYIAKPLLEFLISSQELFREEDAITFEIGISTKGADIFHKEHYPSMELYHENEKYYIRGFYNKGEERFIASYFAAYGETIFSIKPVILKKLILERLDTIKKHLYCI